MTVDCRKPGNGSKQRAAVLWQVSASSACHRAGIGCRNNLAASEVAAAAPHEASPARRLPAACVPPYSFTPLTDVAAA